MESWLILLGVLLPLVPFLQLAEQRLDASTPRVAPVAVENRPPSQRS